MIQGHWRIQIVLLISCYLCCIDSSPDRLAAGCSWVPWWRRLCLKWLLVCLMLSKQSRAAPPWLQSQDRPSLDYQAGKRLTADCLDTSDSSEAQGIAREVLGVRLCVFVCGKKDELQRCVCLPRECFSVFECVRDQLQNTLHSRWLSGQISLHSSTLKHFQLQQELAWPDHAIKQHRRIKISRLLSNT